MSVIVLVRFEGDPTVLLRTALENEELVMKIVTNAKTQYGAIHHQFIGGIGEVAALDEWPSQTAFETFFEANGVDIKTLTDLAGVTAQPTIEVWDRLDTPDRF